MLKKESNDSSTVTKSPTKSVWSRLFIANSDWEDKEEFLDVIYWGRQVVAVIIGIIWGILGLQGILGIASFSALNSIIVYIYSVKVNNDQEETFEYVKEGFMTAFAAFMVSWIVTYSYVYY